MNWASNHVFFGPEWGGMATGLLGSMLLAFNSAASGYGFVFFLISNVLWIYASAKRRNYALLLMMGAYSITSLYGLYAWLF